MTTGKRKTYISRPNPGRALIIKILFSKGNRDNLPDEY
jgi:hypothetical protein